MSVTAAVLFFMGRPLVCRCGVVSWWSGDIWSNQNSQQFSDPYTFTHITHGTGFYGLLWLAGRGWPPGRRLLGAVILESSWEILENTDFIINRYREETISLDYFGDSVLNSVGDIMAMMVGFFIASRLPARVTLGGTALLELALLLTIRDSLIINIIMLIHPSEAIRQWQTGLR
jgi:hypothetical protein